MNDLSAKFGLPSSEPAAPARLEDRVAQLEQTLQQVVAFNKSVTEATTHLLGRLAELEPMVGKVVEIDYRLNNRVSVQALTHVSKIYPKTRSVIFVSRDYFGDNTKAAYLAFIEYARMRDVTVNFLTDDKRQLAMLKGAGLPCLSGDPESWSLEDIKTLLSAKVIVLTENFHPFAMDSPKAFAMLQGAKVVQMWHGIPIKKIGLQYILRSDNVLLEQLLASAGPYDAMVGTAANARDEWAQMFSFREFAATGYPRNDVLFRDITARDRMNVDLNSLMTFEAARQANKPVILYAPTFRDDAASGWFDKAGIVKLAEHARLRGYCFAVNLHPFEQGNVEQFRQRYSGIHFIQPGTDIYPLVKSVDTMITDYSSLVFDYLLLDRPVVFYRPDHDYYMQHSRGFIEGREKLTPGAVAATIDELITMTDAASVYALAPDADPYRAARLELRGKLFDNVDGKSSQRVCDLIMKFVDVV